MSETLAQLKVLIFLLLIFGLTIGIVSKKRMVKFIAAMIWVPLLVAVGLNYFRAFRGSLDPTSSMLFTIAILLVVLVVALRLILGKDIWHSVAGDFIYDVLKWLFFLPFRILRGILRLFIRRGDS